MPRVLSFDVGIKNLSFADVRFFPRAQVAGTRNGDEKPGCDALAAEPTVTTASPSDDRPRVLTTLTSWTSSVCGWGCIDITQTRSGGAERGTKYGTFDATCTSVLEALRDNFGDDAEGYDYVIIENQPVMKNPAMKTIQIVLYTYFQTVKMLFGSVGEVRLVAASMKLRDVGGSSSLSYAQKKALAVRTCRDLLSSAYAQQPQYRQQFDACKKKDDLADCMLQAHAFANTLAPIEKGCRQTVLL